MTKNATGYDPRNLEIVITDDDGKNRRFPVASIEYTTESLCPTDEIQRRIAEGEEFPWCTYAIRILDGIDRGELVLAKEKPKNDEPHSVHTYSASDGTRIGVYFDGLVPEDFDYIEWIEFPDGSGRRSFEESDHRLRGWTPTNLTRWGTQ